MTPLRRVALLLFAVAFGTNVATPLLIIYRQRLDLTPTVVTAIFGVYALGLLPSLLLAGPISDRVGRRAVVLPFAALAIAVSVLFVPAASNETLLFVARFLQGLVSGAVFSTGSAWLQDLAPADRPGQAAAGAGLAMNAGFSLGPLMSGFVATGLPHPTTLPFLFHVLLLIVVIPVALRVAGYRPPAEQRRPISVTLPPAHRRQFLSTAAPTAVVVFALPSVGITLLPLLVPNAHNLVLITGIMGGLTLGTAALMPPLVPRLGRAGAPVAAVLGASGYLLGVLGGHLQSEWVLLVAAATLGAGSGIALTCGLGLVGRMSDPTNRGAVNGIFYCFAYLGFGVPLLIAQVSRGGSLTPAVSVAAALLLLTASWLATGSRARVLSPMPLDDHLPAPRG